MRHFYFVTLFPEAIHYYTNCSILKQAQLHGYVQIHVIDLRQFATNQYGQVDDYQYGGGAGMVLMIEPVYACLQQLDYQTKHVILLTPRGEVWTQNQAHTYANHDDRDIIFLCGHYEGFDERIYQYVDASYSIGDYVLTSGELASLVLADSIIRLLPGVINPNSLVSESFNDDLLDHPVYTKPQVFGNHAVPEVLLSGHHAKIAQYRHQMRLSLTQKYRPDLYAKYLQNQSQKTKK